MAFQKLCFGTIIAFRNSVEVYKVLAVYLLPLIDIKG